MKTSNKIIYTLDLTEEYFLKLGWPKERIPLLIKLMNLELKMINSRSFAHHLKNPLEVNGEDESFEAINSEAVSLLNSCSDREARFSLIKHIVSWRQDNYQQKSMIILAAVEQLGLVGAENDNIDILDKTVEYLKHYLNICLDFIRGEESRSSKAFSALMSISYLNNIAYIMNKIGDSLYVLENYKKIWILANNYLNSLDHPLIDITKNALIKHCPEFFKTDASRAFIISPVPNEFVPKGINELIIKYRLQQKILNNLHEKTLNGKWSQVILTVEWGVKGYIEDKYISKSLGKYNSPQNVEIAKLFCLEAISLATLNNKNNTLCLETFIRQNPDIITKALSEHKDLFVDGSIIQIVENINNDLDINDNFLNLDIKAENQQLLLGELGH